MYHSYIIHINTCTIAYITENTSLDLVAFAYSSLRVAPCIEAFKGVHSRIYLGYVPVSLGTHKAFKIQLATYERNRNNVLDPIS